MKRTGLVALVALLFWGCSDNELKITNRADAQIAFSFRAKEYTVQPEATVTVSADDVPNGTYDYTTVVTIPAGYTDYSLEEGCSGSLTFERSSTSILIIYASMSSSDSTSRTYTVGATVSSSDPAGAIVAP